MKISISAFFPAYNDEHTIEALVRTVTCELRRIGDDFEVIVVNDGSQDKTRDVLIVELRVIHHPQNRGYGAALITGFAKARKEFVFYTDGDGQYDVREIHNLLLALRPEVDLVNGYKVRRADPWYRVWIGEAYRRGMRFFFNLAIRDVDCDFRLFRRSVLRNMTLESQSGVICVEMMRKFQVAGCRVVEVPVSHLPRLHGSSQFFRLHHLIRVFVGLFKVWWKLVLLPQMPFTSVAKPSRTTSDYRSAEIE
jgi:glycosyltransferase involved in cell wall biosynthesis